MSKLHLIRGLPGSGKSTMAKKLGISHLETDMYFMEYGEYLFDATRLGDAHKWCQERVEHVMESGRDVVVSNTFSQLWEMDAYLNLAYKYDYELIVHKCVGKYNSIHNVPSAVIERTNECTVGELPRRNPVKVALSRCITQFLLSSFNLGLDYSMKVTFIKILNETLNHLGYKFHEETDAAHEGTNRIVVKW